MFRKILIANRGEIACRVIKTARRLGVRTVAVFSEADANARHTRLADEAVLIGPPAARDSYLAIDRIIAAARQTGAEAIHPGYGFLSENEDFAAACAANGIVFIGPPVEAIRAMGSKSAAKTLMETTAVPLVPGYHGDKQDKIFLQKEADRIGYPVLLKPSAGGGGKGMRIVTAASEFADALASCKREATSSFGDDHVLIEKYVTRPRHVEIQVFADRHGHCVYLFERDCSVQRRHQKVLEEAPAPGMTESRRRDMGEAAVAAARAVNYVGAGTVEFIADQDGRFYFMEMNTRLQVEHPVTEMITGQDLVEWQLRVAAGEPLPLTQEQLAIRGHSLEARIYAEDPDKGFLPSTGKLVHLAPPPESLHVRVDTGVEQGDEITPYYDPMIAKLIVWDQTRELALQRMLQALAQYRIVGVANNVEFLSRLVACPAFTRADLDTGLIERERDFLFPQQGDAPDQAYLIAALATLLREEERARATTRPGRRSVFAVEAAGRMAAQFAVRAPAPVPLRRYRTRGRRRLWRRRLSIDARRHHGAGARRARTQRHAARRARGTASGHQRDRRRRKAPRVPGRSQLPARARRSAVSGQRRAGRRRRPGRADAGQGHRLARAARCGCGKGRAAADTRGDEDGAHDHGAHRRQGPWIPFRRRRTGDRGRGARRLRKIETRMSVRSRLEITGDRLELTSFIQP